jgi:hypothetical protein
MAALKPGPINTKQHQDTTEHETTAIRRYRVPLPEAPLIPALQTGALDPHVAREVWPPSTIWRLDFAKAWRLRRRCCLIHSMPADEATVLARVRQGFEPTLKCLEG